MTDTPTTRIRLFGNLHTLRRERGLPPVAEELDLPLTRIEGVFCNHIACSLDKRLNAGDEIAFIPTGVPGPHRFMLGIYAAGKG